MSEKLPEDNTDVIVCFYSGTVTEMRYWRNGIFQGIYEHTTKSIVAWMPLPKPYKANALCKLVDSQPTAFDVEKVLNELKHEESEALRRYSESKGTAYAFSDKCSCDNWAKAIEIVKRGGRDEE